MHSETILWLNKQIDDNHAQSVLVGELLMDEDDSNIVKKYDKKLQELENELKGINRKVEVEKEVLVDNENLSLVYKYVVDQEGDLTELDISEIDDNGVNELVNQIVFVNDIKSIAAQEVRAEIADLVDKEVVDSVSLDEDDVERVRVDDDFDEILVDDIDFEDKDASLLVSGSFEHDDIDYVFEVEVEFKDGALDDLSLVSLAKK
jgi:hypothetical protein